MKQQLSEVLSRTSLSYRNVRKHSPQKRPPILVPLKRVIGKADGSIQGGEGEGGCIVLILNKSKILSFLDLMCKLVTFNPFNDLIFFSPGLLREASHMEMNGYGSTEHITALYDLLHDMHSQSISTTSALTVSLIRI